MTVWRIVNLLTYGLAGLTLFLGLHFYQPQGWILAFILGLGVILFLGIIAEIIIIIIFEPIKQKILREIPQDLTLTSTKSVDHPHLDRMTLDRWTDALEYLGFQQLGDFSPQTESGNHSPGFIRLLVHPRQHCFGEIHQIFPPPTTQRREPQAEKITCSLTSDLMPLVLFTTNRPDMAFWWIMRLPDYLWQSFSDKNPRELLSEHLQKREQLIQDFSLNLQTNLTVESYIECTQELLAKQKREISKKDIFKIISEINRFQKNPRSEWWGKYSSLAD